MFKFYVIHLLFPLLAMSSTVHAETHALAQHNEYCGIFAYPSAAKDDEVRKSIDQPDAFIDKDIFLNDEISLHEPKDRYLSYDSDCVQDRQKNQSI